MYLLFLISSSSSKSSNSDAPYPITTISFSLPEGKTASKLKPATIFSSGTGELLAKYSDPRRPDSSKVTAKNKIDLSVLTLANLLESSKTTATPVALSTAPL